MSEETIVALATPPGVGGIGTIRISGPQAARLLRAVAERVPKNIPARRIFKTFIRNKDRRIDEALAAYFPAPGSYTGEDVVEISIHGSPVLAEVILGLLCSLGARMARPGEFTLRAYQNGKIDLIQAESINELIHSGSYLGARLNFSNLEGGLSALVGDLRNTLMELGILVESAIEFAEDQNLGEITLLNSLEKAAASITRILKNRRFNEVMQRGLNVVIAGRVNVGKSSLFNYLLLEDRSIISASPGTTRDFIREKLYVKGFPVNISDVAGLNSESEDDIESQGIRRSLERISQSDAVLFLLDCSTPLTEADREMFAIVRNKPLLVAVNKIDAADRNVLGLIRKEFSAHKYCEVSVIRDTNLDCVHGFLEDLVADLPVDRAEFAVNARQRDILEKISGCLAKIIPMIKGRDEGIEIAAEEIHVALDLIGELTGHISRQDIINGIFKKFCIGK